MIEDVQKDASGRMDRSVLAFTKALMKLRTGRAHPGLLEHIEAEYYGSNVPLNQVANLAVEDSRTLTVTPWEQQMVPVIEKAIRNSDLGLNPVTAGSVIRVPLPDLTEERRRDLARLVKQEAEHSRVAIRNVRRDALSDLKEMVKEKLITEDDERRAHHTIQELTDKHTAAIDKVSEEKQHEVMEF